MSRLAEAVRDNDGTAGDDQSARAEDRYLERAMRTQRLDPLIAGILGMVAPKAPR